METASEAVRKRSVTQVIPPAQAYNANLKKIRTELSADGIPKGEQVDVICAAISEFSRDIAAGTIPLGRKNPWFTFMGRRSRYLVSHVEKAATERATQRDTGMRRV